MTDQIGDDELYEGVSVNIEFDPPGPTFGDVYLLSGQPHPQFPPSGNFAFDKLDHLQFSQVDDYFGVKTLSDVGDDVAVWLYPVIDGEPVEHHSGPFDALRWSTTCCATLSIAQNISCAVSLLSSRFNELVPSAYQR